MHRQHVIDAGLFKVIDFSLKSRENFARVCACAALGSVVTGTREQRQLFFEHPGLLDSVMRICLEDEFNVRKEAGWCLANAVDGEEFAQIELMVRRGFFKAMIELLKSAKIPAVLSMAIKAIDGALTMFNEKHGKKEDALNPWVQCANELGIIEILDSIKSDESVPDSVVYAAVQLE